MNDTALDIADLVNFPDPLRIADETFLIRPMVQPPGAPFAMHVNSMVILGAEPVIVDTCAALMREDWMDQVFGLVDPDDVRWVFLSHDDSDHAGNLGAVLDICPNATLVTSWFANERMSGDLMVAPQRQRWVNDGESFIAGDRTLVAVRPPMFDSPTTRGLFDTSSGVYWSSDAFGTPVSGLVDHVDDLPRELLDEGSTMLSSFLCPWHTVVDPGKYASWVDRIADLRPAAIVGAHGPLVSGGAIESTLDRARHLPHVPLLPQPGQADLDALITLLAA
jgi:flavorubredoxin